MAWGKAGSTTTSATGTSLTVSGLSSNNIFQFLGHMIPVGADAFRTLKFNGDSGSNYAIRNSDNGGADGTSASQTGMTMDQGGSWGSNDVAFNVMYCANISGKEKLIIHNVTSAVSAGAGTAPRRREYVGKWTGTDQITSTVITSYSGTGFGATSNFTVLGSDLTPAPSTPAVPAIPALMPSLQSPSVGGWVEVGRTTLGSAGDTISVASLADKRYYMFLIDDDPTGACASIMRINNDSGSNYSIRTSADGGSDSTEVSRTSLQTLPVSHSTPAFSVGYTSNLSSKEKLFYNQGVYQSTAGAGTAPSRNEMVSKWVNTSNAINRYDEINVGAGSYNTGSEVVVLGWDPADSHTTNFWEELASVELSSAANSLSTGTFTSKKYLWIQYHIPSSAGAANNYDLRVGNSSVDTGSNYGFRYSINGAADATATSQDTLKLSFNGGSGSEWAFGNVFVINNSANEKLFISDANRNHISGAGTGTAPNRYQVVGKWANTSSQINIMQLYHQTGASTFGAGTIMKVWGSD
tara:strand:+ start:1247 stop:2815 length:1569 start_codon:yes stop_codon:yes gene_type:complete